MNSMRERTPQHSGDAPCPHTTKHTHARTQNPTGLLAHRNVPDFLNHQQLVGLIVSDEHVEIRSVRSAHFDWILLGHTNNQHSHTGLRRLQCRVQGGLWIHLAKLLQRVASKWGVSLHKLGSLHKRIKHTHTHTHTQLVRSAGAQQPCHVKARTSGQPTISIRLGLVASIWESVVMCPRSTRSDAIFGPIPSIC
jgi:hypothetical protein